MMTAENKARGIEPKYWRRYFSPQVLSEPFNRAAARRRLVGILAAAMGLGGIFCFILLLLLAFFPPGGG